MKVLTIWQPWASLVVIGAKPYEFRSWPAPRSIIGHQIGIHAAARPMVLNELKLMQRSLLAGPPESAFVCLKSEVALPLIEEQIHELTYHSKTAKGHGTLPWGCVIGAATIGEPRNGMDIAAEFGLETVNDSDRHEHANFGWPMLDVQKWEDPVPMRGLQGLWNYPEPKDVIG